VWVVTDDFDDRVYVAPSMLPMRGCTLSDQNRRDSSSSKLHSYVPPLPPIHSCTEFAHVPQAAPSICSGYCSVLSLIGEVFVWLGKGSVAIERQAAVSFANVQAVSLMRSLPCYVR
jgi:hypothetical protein